MEYELIAKNTVNNEKWTIGTSKSKEDLEYVKIRLLKILSQSNVFVHRIFYSGKSLTIDFTIKERITP